jgi:hypothetical protein
VHRLVALLPIVIGVIHLLPQAAPAAGTQRIH